MPINTSNTTVTRVKNDANGNPRYVIHWLELLGCEPLSQWDDNLRMPADSFYDVGLSYDLACTISKPAGFKRYHNQLYDGGLVVQSYNIQDSLADLQYACEDFVSENTDNQALTDHVLSCIDLSEYKCKSLHKIIKAEKRVTRLTLAIVQDWLQGLPSACTVEYMNHTQDQVLTACGLVGWSSDMYWRYTAKVILAYKS